MTESKNMAISIFHRMIPKSEDHGPTKRISMVLPNVLDRLWSESKLLRDGIVGPLIRPAKDQTSVAVFNKEDKNEHHDHRTLILFMSLRYIFFKNHKSIFSVIFLYFFLSLDFGSQIKFRHRL